MPAIPAICKTSSEFIGHIKHLISHGARFSPFLGSGISAQSGILMGQEFPDYIAYTVYRVLGGGGKDPEYWDIRERGWPPYPTSQEIDDTYTFILKEYQNLVLPCKAEPGPGPRPKIVKIDPPNDPYHAGDVELNRILIPSILRTGKLYDLENHLDAKRRHLRIQDTPNDPNLPPSSTRYIREAALRSLSHWTRTLEFLSKVAVADGPHRRLYLDDEPDIAVIDSFNAYITRGKKPNLIHNMISRLSRSLRSQVILTTNFDTLIEESYRAQGEPLHSLAVSIKGGLPSFATVRAQDCLIKLHGDILETRADSTINDPPTDRDKKLFFQYLRGPREPQHKQPDDFVQSHLIVLGYSASDARCVQMIKYVLDLAPDFRVYWVSHSDRDTKNICKIFGDYMRVTADAKAREPQLRLYQTDRTDLLLWELYQQINLSLPGGGYSVQFNHFVPPLPYNAEPPSASTDELPADLAGTDVSAAPATATAGPESPLADTTSPYPDGDRYSVTDVERIRESLIRATTLQQGPDKHPGHNIVCIDSPSGTARPLQAGFYALQKTGYETAWIELEDHRGAPDFFFQILSIIAQRIGQFQLEWTTFMPITTTGTFGERGAYYRIRLLVEKFKIDPTKWFFFLYGRNGPGGCTGWSKDLQQLYWDKDTLVTFEALLKNLAHMGFRIIYMPHGPERQKHNHEKINEVISVARNCFTWDKLEREDHKAREKKAYNLLHVTAHDIPGSLLHESHDDIFHPPASHSSSQHYSKMLDRVCKDFIPFSNVNEFFRSRSTEALLTDGPPLPEEDLPLAEGGTRAARCLWLYGLTLFRHSRHPSSLISEAVFPCPRKYVQGDWTYDPSDKAWDHRDAPLLMDNDLLRNWLVFTDASTPAAAAIATPTDKTTDDAKTLLAANKLDEIDTEGWLNVLARHGVIMRKPGGYAWKYRDARLGIQFLLEEIKDFKFDAELFGEVRPPAATGHSTASGQEEPPPLDSGNNNGSGGKKAILTTPTLRALRARLHYYIGEWYLRAFYSTGHYMPLIEAIYQSVQCLEFIGEYCRPHGQHSPSPSEDETHADRLSLAWLAVCQIRRLLLVGRKSLLFWCPGLDIATTFFDPEYDKVIERWKSAFPTTTNTNLPAALLTRFHATCDILVKEIEHLKIAVQVEGYAHGGRSSPLVPYSSISPSVTPPQPSHGSADIDHREWHASSINTLCGAPQLPGTPETPGIPGFIDPAPYIPATPTHHRGQRDILTRLFTEDPNTNQADVSDLKNRWTTSWAAAGAKDENAYEGAWLISELMYRAVRRAKLHHHSHPHSAIPHSPEEISRIWRAVSALGHLGLHLCSHLSADLHQADCDLRVRILTVYAVALTYLERFAEAARRFNEAHALIISGMGTTSGRELARIHVRRSEMYLWKARVLLTKHTRWTPAALRALTDPELIQLHPGTCANASACASPSSPLTPAALRALGDDALSQEYATARKPLTPVHLQQIIVCVDDAWTALERGELGLGGVSHSTYWWYRLIALKLSCYATLGDIHKRNLPAQPPGIGTGISWTSGLEACLPFRRRLHLPSVLVSLLRDGLIISAGDHFRQLRLLSYVLHADELLQPQDRIFGQAATAGAPPTGPKVCPTLEAGYLTLHQSHYHQLLADIWRVLAPAEHPPLKDSEGLIAQYSDTIRQELEARPAFYKAACDASAAAAAGWANLHSTPIREPVVP